MIFEKLMPILKQILSDHNIIVNRLPNIKKFLTLIEFLPTPNSFFHQGQFPTKKFKMPYREDVTWSAELQQLNDITAQGAIATFIHPWLQVYHRQACNCNLT